ncbi:MAG: BCD family MFS transporter [Chloroflexota bacterium]
MAILKAIGRFILALIKTFRLALPKLGVGWMFALLTINFNRITISELEVAAIVIGLMLALHYFLSPFQVISGRIADRNPIFGMRRTPYLLMAAVAASLIFLALPSAAVGMGNGSALAFAGGFGLLLVYGIAIAVMGDAHHSLIAEVVTPERRGGVISVVWTFTILSSIIAAVVMGQIMPEYDPATMQFMYNLTPFIVIISAFVGVIGIEKRMTAEETAAAIERSKEITPEGNPVVAAITVLRENKEAWGFFAFIFISILSIFLQDVILEPFGSEVFGMTVEETTNFQPAWGGGVLIGMLLMGAISSFLRIRKRTIALVGTIGTAFGYAALAYAAFTLQENLITPSLTFMGFFTGFFNVGALSMMMDMTVEGATGLYMGLWGMAQAFGNGMSSVAGGGLHTLLIGSGFLAPELAYTFIFGLEALGMTIAAVVLVNISVSRFKAINEGAEQDRLNLRAADALTAMEAGIGT